MTGDLYCFRHDRRQTKDGRPFAVLGVRIRAEGDPPFIERKGVIWSELLGADDVEFAGLILEATWEEKEWQGEPQLTIKSFECVRPDEATAATYQWPVDVGAHFNMPF